MGCNTTFETVSTVDKMDVELCSQCHPFYTGKQKLIDTAGRVDRFRALQKKAQPAAAAKKAKPATEAPAEVQDVKAKLAELKDEIVDHTVETDKTPKTDSQDQ